MRRSCELRVYEAVPHIHPWCCHRGYLDFLSDVRWTARQRVAVPALRQMVFRQMVVQPKFHCPPMCALWLA
jgi:hypothetical protein